MNVFGLRVKLAMFS